METFYRYKNAALGLVLVLAGFVGGYFSQGPHHRGHRPAPPPHAMYGQAWAPGPGMDPRLIDPRAMRGQARTTIIVVQNGQPMEMMQSGPVAVANPPQAMAPNPDPGPRYGLLFALLVLSAMPAVVWGALAWNRRRNNSIGDVAFAEPQPYQEFVPRRDD